MERYLVLGITLALAAVVQPGPLQGYLISRALARGWKRTAPAALAPVLSDGPIIVVVLVVLTRIPSWFERVLQVAGGIYLLFLAAAAFRAWRAPAGNRTERPAAGPGTLLQAVAVNLLNPNPYLAWCLVLGPTLLKGWRETPGHAIALLAGFYSTMVAGLLATITLSSAARSLGPRVARVLTGLSAVALAAFGLYSLALGTGLATW